MKKQCVTLALAVLVSQGANAIDLPILKSGLWEVARVSDMEGGQRKISTVCLDANTQREMMSFGMGASMAFCPENDRRFEGNRLTIKATCQFNQSTIRSETVMTFQGDSAYHTEVSATYDPPFLNIAQSRSTLDGRWVGPCPANQQPGDLTLETGETINIRAMLGN